MKPTTVAAFIVIIVFYTPTSALLGFDCSGHQLNATTISLLGAAECDLRVEVPSRKPVYIQLLQLSKYNYANVIQCKVEMHRVVHYCGMHSHISAVRAGEATFIEEIGYERCKEMHQQRSAAFAFNEDSVVKGLETNKTNYRSITLAGTLSFDGKCKGGKYSDPYGTYEDVVVQAAVKITLKTSHVPTHLEKGEIILKSGTICELKRGYCIDSDDGYSFWTPMPASSCDFHQYDVLYQGQAIKMRDTTQENQPTVYSLTTNEITFALTTGKQQPVCGYTLLQTEHPKLFIVETTQGNVPKTQSEFRT